MVSPCISVITTFHSEGRLAKATIESWELAFHEASNHDIRVEWICILDNPDEETKRICAALLPDEARVYEVDLNDAGNSRNYGVEIALGQYICISDADDLVSSNWLVASLDFLRNKAEPIVAHASLCVFFERELRLAHLPEVTDGEQTKERLLGSNLWTALSFGRREIFQNVPYKCVDATGGYGYEDWLWNCDTVSKNIIHRIVPDTIHCVRLKAWKPSLLSNYKKYNCVMPASDLFQPHYKEHNHA